MSKIIKNKFNLNQEEKKPRKKIGLALGGGGAKGLAHIGVIKTLEKFNVPIDYIAGTSMGALIGGWYSSTKDVALLERIFSHIKTRDIKSMGSILKKKDGKLFQDKTIAELLEIGFQNKKIEDCPIPFSAVATDVENGDEVIIDKGSLLNAIRASIALPLIFNPVKHQDKILMDGGFVNPVPADIVKNMGADIVIAVDVSSQWIKISDNNIGSINTYSLISQALSAIEFQIAKKTLEKADIVLKPAVLSFDWMAFDNAKDIIEEGKREANSKIKEIEKKSEIKLNAPKDWIDKFIDIAFYED